MKICGTVAGAPTITAGRVITTPEALGDAVRLEIGAVTCGLRLACGTALPLSGVGCGTRGGAPVGGRASGGLLPDGVRGRSSPAGIGSLPTAAMRPVITRFGASELRRDTENRPGRALVSARSAGGGLIVGGAGV